MELQNITLRVVIFKSGNSWVSQCLEYDIAAQAKSPKELPYELGRAIVGHMVIAEENGMRPFENVPEAPRRYWNMFEQGLKAGPPKEHFFSVQGHSNPPPVTELSFFEPTLEPA